MNTTVKPIAYSINGTPVYSHPEAHPHRVDLTVEAINKMTIPAVPVDPADRAQTRHCEVVDFGRAIGVNHRTELKEGMRTFYMIREDHDYPSLMTIDGMPTIETRTTNVCFWDADNSCWVLWTNHEGVEDQWPEPGSVRFQHLSEEDQKKAIEWHKNHPLICTSAEIEKAKKEGLIKKEWYFRIGEDDIPLGPCQQPWVKWSNEIGPFDTEEEAQEKYEKECKKIENKWEWVTPVCSRFEETWLDKANNKLKDLKFTIENREEILARYEGTDKMQSFIERIKERLPENKKRYEEMKIICK